MFRRLFNRSFARAVTPAAACGAGVFGACFLAKPALCEEKPALTPSQAVDWPPFASMGETKMKTIAKEFIDNEEMYTFTRQTMDQIDGLRELLRFEPEMEERIDARFGALRAAANSAAIALVEKYMEKDIDADYLRIFFKQMMLTNLVLGKIKTDATWDWQEDSRFMFLNDSDLENPLAEGDSVQQVMEKFESMVANLSDTWGISSPPPVISIFRKQLSDRPMPNCAEESVMLQIVSDNALVGKEFNDPNDPLCGGNAQKRICTFNDKQLTWFVSKEGNADFFCFL
eukprot:32614_1